MNIQQFQAKWRGVDLKERSAAQEHFIDLCRLLGQSTPAEADKTGAEYTFERGTVKTGGGQGFADVWKRNHFAWEYKGNRANLDAAYQQLLQYREDLENPPLLVVSDFERFEVHTNFTGTVKQVHEFTLEDLDSGEPITVLRSVFSEPYRLRPDRTVESVTEEAAARFGRLALSLAARGVTPDRAAHFLVQMLFCLFAEDIGLLPNRVFSKMLDFSVRHPGQFTVEFTRLAEAMRDGGFVGYEDIARFNGGLFATINSDLTAMTDITSAKRLNENRGIAFMGGKKVGPFEIPGELARQWLALPPNPNGRTNEDVVVPWVNGMDVTRRPRDMWIVDFGAAMDEENASFYEAPYEYVKKHVKPAREGHRDPKLERLWWIHGAPASGMRDALRDLDRYIATARVAKHRLFDWIDSGILADCQLIVFARDDDSFFGVLHSRAHEVWSLRMGTSLEDRPRYTPTTTFETFPFPRPTEEQREAIGAAAMELDEKRRAWLDPPGATEAGLKKRTLTNLYNQRPTWLAQLHDRLDRAVWSAYGWDDSDPGSAEEDVILSRLLALNTAIRSAGCTTGSERDRCPGYVPRVIASVRYCNHGPATYVPDDRFKSPDSMRIMGRCHLVRNHVHPVSGRWRPPEAANSTSFPDR